MTSHSTETGQKIIAVFQIGKPQKGMGDYNSALTRDTKQKESHGDLKVYSECSETRRGRKQSQEPKKSQSGQTPLVQEYKRVVEFGSSQIKNHEFSLKI